MNTTTYNDAELQEYKEQGNKTLSELYAKVEEFTVKAGLADCRQQHADRQVKEMQHELEMLECKRCVLDNLEDLKKKVRTSATQYELIDTYIIELQDEIERTDEEHLTSRIEDVKQGSVTHAQDAFKAHSLSTDWRELYTVQAQAVQPQCKRTERQGKTICDYACKQIQEDIKCNAREGMHLLEFGVISIEEL